MYCAAAFFFATQLLSPVIGAQNAATTNFTCQPGQPCWSTIAQWQAFNQTIAGRLKITTMLASPCFPSSPNFNDTECADIRQNYTSAQFRGTVYGAMDITQWEACGSANCYPGFLQPQRPTCALGRLSALYVDAEEPADVTATLGFVRRHGIRLVVKNTGHDVLGRSAAANTLALRVYNLKNMSFHSSFTARNCSTSNRQNVGVIGAGVSAEDAVAFFSKQGMMVTVGGCPSVGIAGGFGQGGGHGPLAPSVGLMADQAIEFDVVTMDGVFRTINKCNAPDLFWAMRGGGGQSYAILINYKFQLHPQVAWANWRLEATLTPPTDNITQNTLLRDILTTLADQQITWSENRIAGYNGISPTSLSMMEMLPGGEKPLQTLQSNAFYIDNFESPRKVNSLVTSTLKAMQKVVDQLGAQLAPQETTAWSPDTPDAIAMQITAAARAALDIIKEPLAVQAAYLNEADPEEPDWQHIFFGKHYSKLLQIKRKWDPDTLLNCKKCVGYLGPRDPMYSCDGDAPNPSVPYPFT
ncbi:FAD binding domain-containing protein [Trichoderma breve]|uniref:FAD binding domain-containing protein n=1 Tax=Trichoderma breve TaxID=2034170 RepID=A0A9W9E623_9HYPO|nr:FAD binding domain-containing protein [Trichoderma breve]KAJ4858770.1 FAD binding domain-containing protein [Trichoderma breve]